MAMTAYLEIWNKIFFIKTTPSTLTLGQTAL